jgi:hypothetical protein
VASRFAEANAICERTRAERLHNWITHSVLYSVAIAEADNTAMQREINWFNGDPMESWVVMNQADNAMALGHLRRSRELFDHARMLALKQDLKEFADEITEDQAGSEADLGNAREEMGDQFVGRSVPGRYREQDWLAVEPDSLCRHYTKVQ